MAGDLTRVMDTPEILGISNDELANYTPRHPERFRRPPLYRYGGPLYARLPGHIPDSVWKHFDVPRTKLYCSMGVSGSPQVLNDVIDIVSDLNFKALIVTTTILAEETTRHADRVMLVPHVPAHLVSPRADIALTHGGAGTVQTAIHAATPLVGVPMHLEQAGNISLVARQGAGIMLSRPELTRRKLGSALEKLVTDSSFLANMQRLRKLQYNVDGARNAAREIIRFLAGDD